MISKINYNIYLETNNDDSLRESTLKTYKNNINWHVQNIINIPTLTLFLYYHLEPIIEKKLTHLISFT